ncbi:MAG: TonB-dependent receptor [Holophagaceae bacterium]|uniref:TonB-dependent receptor n=1 Tax=Candidatus Geothrix skivensis TaxID=2954439 RepID=A0A9D7SI20_9BACT|nr:TonB-dependent receptor [Candidatus Geothrix skivensis]
MHLLNNRLGRITALIALGGAALYSQGTQTANITGTVVDAAGAPVAGVMVRLTSPSLQGVRTYTTDATGKFIARLLPPGLYTVTYTKDGLETRKITEQLGVDQTFSPKMTMSKVGGAVVEVIAAAPAVDKTDIKSATNYRMDSVDLLPTANRTMETVALLTPGVTVGVGGRVQMRGAMTSGNLYLLDGQNIADNAYNNRGIRTIDDAIEETQVVTGAMSAEYGDVEGGVINSITRSGSNEFSGSLRWELTNPAWNASRPTENRATALSNVLGEEKTLFVSGPILKDTLWFTASYFKTDTQTALSIGADLNVGQPYYPLVSGLAQNLNNATYGLNAGYQTGRKEIRRQAKLTWAINQDHTLIGSFMNASINDTNRNYSAGELLSLVPQVSTSEFANLTLRSAWTTNFTTEIKTGRKKQNLSAGGAANGQSPIYSYDNGFFYNNGIFNNTDGGDQRDNRTYNVKASLFWNAAGSHQTDFGIDLYQGTRTAKNEQTPTGYIIGAYGLSLNAATQFPAATTVGARVGFGSDIWTYYSGSGSADNYSTGIYVNDKWSIDQHWNFQFGVRFDNYKAKSESGAKTAGASGISPRLGLKYDFFGDSKHIAGFSFARYNAKVLEGITNSVTSQGNPTEIDYLYIGPGGPQSFAALQNLANYDISPAGIAYYNDPALNVKLSDKLKAPTVDEFQANYAYSFNHAAIGEGFLKVTAVSKKWKNLIDYSVGNNGTVLDPTGTPLYLKVWDNNTDAKREYKSLELEGSLNRNGWSYGGNVTWSSLKGNYEGEGTSTPARGEGINAFNVQNGVTLFNNADTAPYGYLVGHNPLRMRLNANRSFTNAYGKTSIGFIYRFDSGAHYSNTRTISRARLGGATLSTQFGTSGTQYLDQTRGAGVFNASSYLDMAATHDFPLFKVAGKDVTAFAKLVIQNLTNHQQIISFNTAWGAATGTYGTPTGGVNSAWVRGSSYGQPTSASGNYGIARTITASAGFRF